MFYCIPYGIHSIPRNVLSNSFYTLRLFIKTMQTVFSWVYTACIFFLNPFFYADYPAVFCCKIVPDALVLFQLLVYFLFPQEYSFQDVRNREHLFSFHRRARKQQFEVDRYNRLHDLRLEALQGLQKLRDPLIPQLPLTHLQKKKLLSEPVPPTSSEPPSKTE